MRPGVWSLQGAPCRLKPVDGWSSGSHVRKTNTPFFACSGMRPWTPEMAILTEETPAHEFGNMKDLFPSKTTILPLSITPDTASKGLRTLAPWNVTRLEMSPPPCRSARTFTVNLPDCRSFHLQGPRIVVLSLNPLTVSDQHSASRLGSQLILLHRCQL